MKNTQSFGVIRRNAGLASLCAALLAITACTQNNAEIYEASNTGGDYTVLNCEQLRVAQLSIDQRLGVSTSYSTTGEPTILLESQRDAITPIRKSRQCPGDPAPAAVAQAPIAADAPDTVLAEGAFLQVATFREASNLDNLVTRLTADGFPVQVRPIPLAGAIYNRVVVGPLTRISEIARIDAAILEMGLADAFFLKQ